MDAIKDLKTLLEKEIMKVTSKGDITPTELKSVGEAVDILKDIETICAMKEYGDDDASYAMSNRGYSSRGSYNYRYPMYRDSYESYDDMSYRQSRAQGGGQGGSSNARGRSRDSYSRHAEKEEMIFKLEQMLNKAQSEDERNTIMECIDKLERGN